VEIYGNAYSVPWRLIGEMVRATIMDGIVRVYHGGQQVAWDHKKRCVYCSTRRIGVLISLAEAATSPPRRRQTSGWWSPL